MKPRITPTATGEAVQKEAAQEADIAHATADATKKEPSVDKQVRLGELIESGEYNVAVSSHAVDKNIKKVVAVLLSAIFFVAIALYALLDTGVISSSVKLPYDILPEFKKANNRSAELKVAPVANNGLSDVTFSNKKISIKYPSDWVTISSSEKSDSISFTKDDTRSILLIRDGAKSSTSLFYDTSKAFVDNKKSIEAVAESYAKGTDMSSPVFMLTSSDNSYAYATWDACNAVMYSIGIGKVPTTSDVVLWFKRSSTTEYQKGLTSCAPELTKAKPRPTVADVLKISKEDLVTLVEQYRVMTTSISKPAASGTAQEAEVGSPAQRDQNRTQTVNRISAAVQQFNAVKKGYPNDPTLAVGSEYNLTSSQLADPNGRKITVNAVVANKQLAEAVSIDITKSDLLYVPYGPAGCVTTCSGFVVKSYIQAPTDTLKSPYSRSAP
jgi:hypothetical protein